MGVSNATVTDSSRIVKVKLILLTITRSGHWALMVISIGIVEIPDMFALYLSETFMIYLKLMDK